jgi:CxxC motif-containing protein (DUF1111 family)
MRKMTWTLALGASLGAVAVWAAAADAPPVARHRHKLAPRQAPARPLPGVALQFGSPLEGLTAAEQLAFDAGRDEFEAVETPEGGLGPIFNDSSCLACHSGAATGGPSTHTVTRFGRLSHGVFDPLDSLGGSLLQAKAIDPELQEVVPPEANVVARRMSTPLFGAGLIEAISDETLDLNARQPQPDGIHGRTSKVLDVTSGKMRVGRFGWKAQQATLLAFAGDAYLNEMGVTNRFFKTENAPNGRTDLLAKYDKVADPEDTVDPATGKSDIDHAADFMRFLAPPPALRATTQSLAGASRFDQARCSACHLPAMFTGPSSSTALAHQPVRLYSDLLLHDMGRLSDGIAQADALGREMRTSPLWGLRVRTAFLHDGRASTIDQAIRQHDGEALRSRQRYEAMTPDEQKALLAFLLTI